MQNNFYWQTHPQMFGPSIPNQYMDMNMQGQLNMNPNMMNYQQYTNMQMYQNQQSMDSNIMNMNQSQEQMNQEHQI